MSDKSAPPIPFLDLKAQHASIREEIFQAVSKILDSQQFILGPEVEALENEMAAETQCRYAIGCASGTDALVLALKAQRIGPGDEVITAPFTFVASAGAIAQAGATPVFVDIEPRTFNIDPAQIEAAITSRTRAIMPVHLFGLTAAMDEIAAIAKGRELPVVEDAAQAVGAQYHGRPAGSLGALGCFSFFPSKNLGGAGDGGMVTTNDPALADRLKLLHLHGSRERYHYEILGMNSRLDALQAAILRVKLRHQADWNAARRRNAARYFALFEEFGLSGKVSVPAEPEGFTHVYNQFTVRVPQRDRLRQKLQAAGVPSEIYYPLPLHEQRAFEYLRLKKGAYPEAERASREVLSLPIFPELTEEQQHRVVASIAQAIDP